MKRKTIASKIAKKITKKRKKVPSFEQNSTSREEINTINNDVEVDDATTSVVEHDREYYQNDRPRGTSDNNTLFNQCLCNVNNEMHNEATEFCHKTTLVLMVPENFFRR